MVWFYPILAPVSEALFFSEKSTCLSGIAPPPEAEPDLLLIFEAGQVPGSF